MSAIVDVIVKNSARVMKATYKEADSDIKALISVNKSSYVKSTGLLC